ncbi:MAG: helix-turn-helix domain-containing protein [Pseudonocardiaceae bacterium]
MARIQWTDREDDVLALVIGGLSNEEIAARLTISRRTVEARLRALFRKAGVTRRTQLAARYQGSDMAPTEPAGAQRPGISDGPAGHYLVYRILSPIVVWPMGRPRPMTSLLSAP